MLRLPTSLLSILVIASCGGAPEVRWTHLAPLASDGTTASAEGARTWRAADGRELRLVVDSEVWIETTIERGDWTPSGAPDLWKVDLPVRGLGMTGVRLSGNERIRGALVGGLDAILADFKGAFGFGVYQTFRDAFYLRWSPDSELPASATLGVRIASRDTVAAKTRVRGRRFSGEGLFVWPNERVVIERELELSDAARVLRFTTCVEPALVDECYAGEAPLRTFRVRVDGKVVFEHAQGHDGHGSSAQHAVTLEGASIERIEFEVEGPLAYTSFLAPVIGPGDVGTYGARAFDAPTTARPPIILFVADTFHADNMALYGGDASLAPNLNAFAEECLRFPNAWSTSTFTLPTHATMFSGMFPRQVTADDFGSALPHEIDTIAEQLARAGYRTGAITDSAVVSVAYGFDQGFEVFDELRHTFDSTIERARAFLEADDGRPPFLFVHTYRVHTPYRATETAPVDPPRGIDERVLRSFAKRVTKDVAPRPKLGTSAERAAATRVRYEEGVTDLDRGFARFLDMLRTFDPNGDAYLVFTSDHGEAFLEHGDMGHEGPVFEEQVRIPFLIRGPGVTPRTVAHPVSLIDMAPTLGALAGIRADRTWLGSPLLALDRARPIYAFECRPERSTVAVVEGTQKLIGYEEARAVDRPWLAFDLAVDPGEQDDQIAGGAEWPAELFERNRTALDTLLQPLVGEQASILGERRINDLEALGYAAGGD